MKKLIKEAENIFEESKRELAESIEKNDEIKGRDACSKAWLATIVATKAFFIKKGVKRKNLPKTYRGIRYFLGRFADMEFRKDFDSLRSRLHIDAYYDGLIDFEELPLYFEIVNDYLETIKNSA